MITAVFWTVAILTATKTTREIQVRPPFEWVGELTAGALGLLIAGLAALALALHVPADPPEYAPLEFQSPVAPTIVWGVWA